LESLSRTPDAAIPKTVSGPLSVVSDAARRKHAVTRLKGIEPSKARRITVNYGETDVSCGRLTSRILVLLKDVGRFAA